MPVDSTHEEYQDALPQWERCRNTYSGSDAVKSKGATYLPELESHSSAEYVAYRMRALFYNAMRATVKGLAGAVFHKPLSVEVPELIEPMLADVTQSSVPLEAYALKTTDEVLQVGRVGLLAEMPVATDGEAGRPYLCSYRAEDIVNWRTERIGGERVLTRVVLLESESAVDPKDAFAYVTAQRYRVLMLDADGFYRVEIWRPKSKANKTWMLDEVIEPARLGARVPFIPFVFIPGIDVTPPPLLDLCDANLSHYRNSADYQNAMHYTGQPSVWISGAAANDDGDGFDLGAGTATMLPPEGKMGILQADGKNAEGLRNLLKDTEGQMATLGARMLEQQAPHQETAHAVRMRHAGEHATLRTITVAVEVGLSMALRYLAWWAGANGADGEVLPDAALELNKDFFGMTMTAEDLKALMLLWQSGGMAWETFYHNMQKGNLTRPDVDAEEERREISVEGDLLPLGG